MKHIVTLFILLIMASSATAQTMQPMQPPMPPGTHPGHPPMETTAPVLKASYPDSVKFTAAFNELYPLIRTTPNIKERAESMVNHMGRTFQTRGLDSAKVLDSVMNAIDQYKDEKLLFAAYRAQFSAEDLKSMILFFKTPAGKHYLEIESQLFNARNGEIDRYVN